MIVLGIETSCDETALSLIDARGTAKVGIKIRVLANQTLSQIKLHKEYGGVLPNLAKREHCRNLIPLLKGVLSSAGFLKLKVKSSKLQVRRNLPTYQLKNLRTILEREPELLEQFLEFIPTIERPRIDAIALTYGPGLEPCLWAGINFAKALSLFWKIPVVPVNHMEGHIVSALMKKAETADRRRPNADNRRSKVTNYLLLTINFPALALLISGGHTELVLVKNWFQYEIIGQTRDDAIGEAFDKVARLLGLPYPGGPEISKLAEKARRVVAYSSFSKGGGKSPSRRISNPSPQKPTVLPLGKGELGPIPIKLPRPMISSDDFDFSFSGIKTAVLYLLKKIEQEAEKNYPRSSSFSIRDNPRTVRVNPRLRMQVAREFEDAVTEVLIAKTKKAIEHYGAKMLLIGGGVIANTHIRRSFEKVADTYGRRYLSQYTFLHIPEPQLTTDNALMIAVAGFLRLTLKDGSTKGQKRGLTAKGNLALDRK